MVEQPIRNRQVASSTLALGSNIAKTSCRLNRFDHALAGVAVGFRFVQNKAFTGIQFEQTAMCLHL